VDPIRVTVRRGRVVESVHRVHVASSRGPTRGEDLVCFLRSAAKPIQALPLVEAYDDLDDDEIAIACASHRAEPAQLAAVRKLLARAEATVADLENGPQQGRPEGKLGHNCSGKHAGMLAACRANAWPFRGYRLPDHPLQQRIYELVGGGATATDGCGVPTFARSLTGAAGLLEGVPARVSAAMRAFPDLIGGPGAADTELMRLRPGWLAKAGAEGLLCAVSPDGHGLALKVEDGAGRAVGPALGALLGIDELASLELRDSLGEGVGAVSAEL
jgi:L-asparaginase II